MPVAVLSSPMVRPAGPAPWRVRTRIWRARSLSSAGRAVLLLSLIGEGKAGNGPGTGRLSTAVVSQAGRSRVRTEGDGGEDGDDWEDVSWWGTALAAWAASGCRLGRQGA